MKVNKDNLKSIVKNADTGGKFLYFKDKVLCSFGSQEKQCIVRLGDEYKDIDGLYDYDQFQKAVNVMKGEEIAIKTEENSIVMSSGRTKIEIAKIDCQHDVGNMIDNFNAVEWNDYKDSVYNRIKGIVFDNSSSLFPGLFIGKKIFAIDNGFILVSNENEKSVETITWLNIVCSKEIVKRNFDRFCDEVNCIHLGCMIDETIYEYCFSKQDIQLYPLDKIDSFVKKCKEGTMIIEGKFKSDSISSIKNAMNISTEKKNDSMATISFGGTKMLIESKSNSCNFSDSIDKFFEKSIDVEVSFTIDLKNMIKIFGLLEDEDEINFKILSVKSGKEDKKIIEFMSKCFNIYFTVK